MKRKLSLTSAAIASVIAMAAAAPAASAATDAVSENWAGYEVTHGSSHFSAASGGWVQPAAKCTTGSQTYSAFWVGLGGGGQGSSALEQIGTQSDCTAGGSTQYYAWYELVPKAPVKLSMTIKPGDKMYARVAVSGSTVTLTLENQTSGASVTKTLHMSNPDTSTAEWVAEAPSQCTSSSLQDCTPLPLTDFGSIKFTNAYATSNGHTGSIGDANWTAQAITLASSSSNEYVGGGYGGYGYGVYGYGTPGGTSSNTAGAQPSSLSSDGTYFTVSYVADGSSFTNSSYPGSGSSGSYGYGGPGYSYGYGYGYGGGYGYGDGYGYGGYGGYQGF